MKIGIASGPPGSLQHQISFYVYDIRSGDIVSVSHFTGTPAEAELEAKVLKSVHESSGIHHAHLAVLVNPEVPAGKGELYVDRTEDEIRSKHPKGRLLRKENAFEPRIKS